MEHPTTLQKGDKLFEVFKIQADGDLYQLANISDRIIYPMIYNGYDAAHDAALKMGYTYLDLPF
jgi:hypothetical protein